jgi:Predicted hydrolases or acyltransferases (alpha/beta hydrolase superfamily)
MGVTSFKVSRGLTYSYIHLKPSVESPKPYILFLHGFPSIAQEWHCQIEHFGNLGYGVIAPDLLGYGQTSRPLDPSLYRLKHMSQDIVDILDHEGIDVAHGVGHDWGTGLLSRLEFFFPRRFGKIALLATGYFAVGAPFNLDALNAITQESLGYSLFGYMKFFTHDPKAVELTNNHV